MIQKTILAILLGPFALLYGIGVSIHQFFYRKGILKSVSFDVPVIAVGNMTVGGTGKTPHTEYLIKILSPYLEIATLSRGYKRKSKGYLQVQKTMNAEMAGDEPLQFKRKFPDVVVGVSENRALGIPRLLMDKPDLQAILLDDAYQHYAVSPGMNILLTTYQRPFTKDFLLPAGQLREWRSGYQRADIILVTKCPKDLSIEAQQNTIKDINPLPHQRVFFTYYQYGLPYYLFNNQQRIKLDNEMDILLISAIARTDYLIDYLESNVNFVGTHTYEDHHYFSSTDMNNLKTTFEKLESSKKIILTTEKDAMRLDLHRSFLIKNRLPIFVMPVEVGFLFNEATSFESDIKRFLLNFKV